MSKGITNIVVAGLGGQGVLKASDILAEAALHAGHDVKKSEIHGMSQRGGSVSSDVRFGGNVLSPMVPDGEADYLVVLDDTQVAVNRHYLREGGILVAPDVFYDEEAGIEDVDDLEHDEDNPVTRRNLNVAILGVLNHHLGFSEEDMLGAIRANLPQRYHEANIEVFRYAARLAQG